MKSITSRHNPLVARYRAAARGDAAGAVLLDGVHLVGAALAAGVPLHEVAVAEGAAARAEVDDLLRRLARRHIEFVTVSAPVMAALSPVRSSSRVAALAARPSADEDALYLGPAPLVVIAVGVQDPGNVGAIVRVAEAAGATGAVAAGATADPLGWKALRGSMGSALRLPVTRTADLHRVIAAARRHGCRIVATAPEGGRSIFECAYTGPVAILIGGEGPGLPESIVDAADERVTIPMRPPVESLNAAVTAALIVYEAYRQRRGGPNGR